MQTAAEMLTDMTLPDERRVSNWNKIMKRETDKLQRERDTEAISGAKMGVILLEYNGGACPSCGREFQRVDVDTPIAVGFYYVPHEHCRCYVRCPRCHDVMVKETMTRMIPRVCDNCGWRLKRVRKGKEETRFGDAYESQYNRTLDMNNAGRLAENKHWCLHDTWDEDRWEKAEARKDKRKKFND